VRDWLTRWISSAVERRQNGEFTIVPRLCQSETSFKDRIRLPKAIFAPVLGRRITEACKEKYRAIVPIAHAFTSFSNLGEIVSTAHFFAFFRIPSQPIKRTQNACRSERIEVSVNHRRLHIGMAQQFLDRSNIFSIFEQMSRKAASKSVAIDRLRQSCIFDGIGRLFRTRRTSSIENTIGT